LRKPRKTPGFHPGQIRFPFSQRGPKWRFQELGEISVRDRA